MEVAEGIAATVTTAVAHSLDEMIPTVYDELLRVAEIYLRNERSDHTLQRTALVHEAFLRLENQPNASWENRAHFLGVFSRTMRQTLTNYAIARSRKKRGGKDRLELAAEFYESRQIDVARVDEALRELERFDPRQSQIVELRFFGGLTVPEISSAMGISVATVQREWALAKVWLHRELSRSD
ncbi:MAG TPA: ECF-type sigma factor [Chthoniobacterales bacterium]|jgi:RNA polymerase sigma factor (TIGR02999 family)|nr:ECF-type sigma factor [Chthoniobacterales bacterium]